MCKIEFFVSPEGKYTILLKTKRVMTLPSVFSETLGIGMCVSLCLCKTKVVCVHPNVTPVTGEKPRCGCCSDHLGTLTSGAEAGRHEKIA